MYLRKTGSSLGQIINNHRGNVCCWWLFFYSIRRGCIHRDHFVYAFSQWETTLQCNIVSHWLGPYTEWSLIQGPLSGWWLKITDVHKVLATERGRYKCNTVSHWLIPCSVDTSQLTHNEHSTDKTTHLFSTYFFAFKFEKHTKLMLRS